MMDEKFSVKMSCHGKPDYTNDLSSNTIGGILKRQLCHDNLNINSLPNELSVSLKSRCFFDAVCNVKIKDIPTNADSMVQEGVVDYL